MLEIRDDNLAQLLTALADGELEAADALAVWDYLAARPDVLRWVRDQQQITVTARQKFRARAPAEIHATIESLLQSGANTSFNARSAPMNPWLKFIGTLAAGLLVGIFIASYLPHRKLVTPPLPSTVDESPVPISFIVNASRTHADCSRLAEALHSASFEKTDASLAAAVHADLANDRDVPDLSSIGYHYVGAGPCKALLPGTVHLLYRQSRPGAIGAISIFVQENHAQFKMTRDTVYAVSSAASPFPMVAWETDRVVYFLITDSERTQQAAIGLLRPRTSTPTSDPSK